MKIAIIGGGAAGFFAAIHASKPGNEVIIFEKSPKILSKVKVSGGGRCNVTHQPLEISKLVKNYPRGEKFLKKAFRHFAIPDTFDWFQSRGVSLKIEADGRVFPVSDSSQTIIDTLVKESQKLGIEIRTSTGIKMIIPSGNQFRLQTEKGELVADRVIVAAGGFPKVDGYSFLNNLNHQIQSPIPSLFTFNAPKEPIRELMGLAVPDGLVKLEGTKLNYQGPILITHWGVSGPAVLKLSAFGAEWLHESNYKAKALINWNSTFSEQGYLEHLSAYTQNHPKRKILSHPLFDLPTRLWEHCCEKSGLSEADLFGNISKKSMNRLIQNLFCYNLEIDGKTTFKEEFVTAGGIHLGEVDTETMQSKNHPNLYFAGEILNLDGITGGFNFQAAWTTGFIAGSAAKN